MKKIIICLGLLAVITSLGGTNVTAEETVDEQAMEITTRALIRVFQFTSKPPKKYKGLILIREKKVKNGYIGYYV